MRRNTRINVFLLVLCSAVFVGASVFAFVQVRDMQTATRGVTVWRGGDLAGRVTTIGVNASLEQYANADLARVVQLIRASGATVVRQHFFWSEIEPRQGEFRWDKWDRIVASASGLQIVAVIDTTPGWARDPGEADLVNAPPRDMNDYARFVSEFVKHYADKIKYVQVWDNPNVHPFWGRRNADPVEYTALLRVSSSAIRAVNASVTILSAGLAPSDELIREHPDYSDVLFLRGMYDAGAKDYFDILGAKPYGLWSGPEDRRVAMDVFNFSRAILLRDEMVAHGDANKPMWAVEFGWNAVPSDWTGKPSPWGSDTEMVQGKRLADAIQRAKSEWGWMPALFVQTFQPNAPADDPQWGFALVDKNFQPRALYTALVSAIPVTAQPATFDFTRFYAIVGGLGLLALFALAGSVVAFRKIAWGDYWRAIQSRFGVLPELAQFILLVLAVIAYYYSPNVILNFVLLAAIVFLFALRIDLGLAIAIFTIPFYLLPKNLMGGAQFSLVEILTLVSVAAWVIRQIFGASRFTFHVSRLRSMDWAILFFVLLGAISVAFAANFGVANRELRVIVLEPALLYVLIRAGHFLRRDLYRLVDAFVLSALVISLIGLYQFAFTNWVIIGEGVRRVLAVYGSPNNLALYLDRALPVVIALALFGDNRRRQILYAVTALIIAVCLYLTYSRGAWLGIVAGLTVIGWLSGGRMRVAVIAMLIVGAILVIPFLQTERAQSLFQEGTGTGFFRVSVWQSAVAMIRDHPILGVGLDNFLYEYPKYISPDAWREPNLSHPHNVVLDFWVRLGIGGVMALAWMLIGFYRQGIKKLRELVGTSRALVIGLIASMTAALAHGMIDAAYFYVDLAFVFMLILGVVMQVDSWVD